MRWLVVTVFVALVVFSCAAEEDDAKPSKNVGERELLDKLANYVRKAQQQRAMKEPEKKIFHCKHEGEACLAAACCHDLVCDRGTNSRLHSGTCRTGCLYGGQTCWKDSQCCSNNCKGVFSRYCVWT